MITAGVRGAITRILRSKIARAAALTVIAAPLIFAAIVVLTPPSLWIDRARFVRPPDAFTIVDRNGEVLRVARVDGADRRWVPLTAIAPPVIDAFLAVEDARFREHSGVDLRASARAITSIVRPWGKRSGGSTISQQLVKMVYGRPHGIFSKLVEVGRAYAIERTFSKDEILEQYLNRVPFGDRIEGVARASEEYFGRPVSSIGVSEAALLAGIPQAPSITEPRRHRDRAMARRGHALARLVAAGVIDDAERIRLDADPPSIREAEARPNDAPRFVDAVIRAANDGAIARRSHVITTSLDRRLQRRVDELARAHALRLAPRGVQNGAAVVIDNATGEILAYVGAARLDPGAPGSSLDLLARRRQPGSTLKPFAYELFFERGGTAASVLDDISLPRTGAEGSLFEAKDYDGRERGPVRARVALASSLNLAALDVAARVGQDKLVARLRDLGFAGLGDADRYGAAAVLGGADVAPIDLARAYVALARYGSAIPLSFVPSQNPRAKSVMRREAASVCRDILMDGAARADAFGADLTDLAGRRFGLKTGTSAGFRDAWAAAFTDRVTVVVWLGDPEGRPLGGVSGFEAAAPLAAKILNLASAPDDRATADATLVASPVCADTGLAPGPGCHHVVTERFAPGSAPSEVCDAHDDHGDLLLPARYSAWIEHTRPARVARASIVPRGEGALAVREPKDGASWIMEASKGRVVVPLRATLGGTEIAGVTWEVDGVRIASDRWDVTPGAHTFIAILQDKRSAPARIEVGVR